MNEKITTRDLIEYFERKMTPDDFAEVIQNGKANGPTYPMVVVFLGADTINDYEQLTENLFRLWPQYKNELLFLGIDNPGEETLYYTFVLDDNKIQKQYISTQEIQLQISDSFGLNNHFPDRTRLLIYYILNSSSMHTADEFRGWLDTIDELKQTWGIDTVTTLEMLMLLLNDDFGHGQRTSSDIRRIIKDLGDSYFNTINSTVILSNRRNDNVILENWSICLRIAADIICLSNNATSNIPSTLFSDGIYTVSYALSQKPTKQIGQVIVGQLIRRLGQITFNESRDIFGDSKIFERLGFGKEHTHSLINQYVEHVLYKELPSIEQLELFPRSTPAQISNISELSEKDFNALTLNTWTAYLDSIIKKALNNIGRDTKLKKQWKDDFGKILFESFSINELIEISANMDNFFALFLSAKEPLHEAEVISAAKYRLKYMLSTNREVISLFIETARSVSEAAKDYRSYWRDIVQSAQAEHDVQDDSVQDFYSHKLEDYFDHHWQGVENSFRKVHSSDELHRFLFNTLSSISKSDPVFQDPFEKELEERLFAESAAVDAQSLIRQQLTGDTVPVYYKATFNLGAPIVESVLLKFDSPLYKHLLNHLSHTYYYNTCNGNSAEAIKIFRITVDNI